MRFVDVLSLLLSLILSVGTVGGAWASPHGMAASVSAGADSGDCQEAHHAGSEEDRASAGSAHIDADCCDASTACLERCVQAHASPMLPPGLQRPGALQAARMSMPLGIAARHSVPDAPGLRPPIV